MGDVGEHSISHTLFTSSMQRASQVTEQHDGSPPGRPPVRRSGGWQIRPAQKSPCLHVRLTDSPATQMSCAQVSGSRSGGLRLVSVTGTPSTTMRAFPSVSAVNV